MKKLIPLLALLLVGCEEFYRYPCQDPANWEKKECQRPACEVDGECSDVLIGKGAANALEEKVEEPQPQPQVEEGG